MLDAEYLAIKDRAADLFLQIPHVNAVGIGGRERGGRPTGEIVIKVFVTRKKPPHDVPPGELIPATFEGIPTDVVTMGPTARRGGEPGVLMPWTEIGDLRDFSPLRGGGSIPVEGKEGRGTLGCMLRDLDDGSAVYALTNHHVVAVDGKLSRSRRVSNGSTEFDLDTAIGIVVEGAFDALHDAALVRLDAGITWIPFVEEIGYIRGKRDLTISEIKSESFEVRKRGSRTGLTGGVVVAIGDRKIEGQLTRNSLIIRPNPPEHENTDPDAPPGDKIPLFSYLGDSGAVVVSDLNEVVALLFAFSDVEEPVVEERGYGFATPIETVLARFRNVEGLNLEVATPKNAAASDPNDPNEQQEVAFPAGVAPLSIAEQVARGDHSYYRPLFGGAQIMADPMLGDANSTTLGCIVTESLNPDIAYALTAYSGVSANGSIPPTSDTEVGQPNNRSSCSGCCSNTVGAFARAGPDATAPTAAIVSLKDDQKWLAEITRIGLVDGSEDVTPEEMSSSGPITVRKSGAASQVTSGVIVRLPDPEPGSDIPPPPPPPTGVPANAILIRPHPNPFRPDDENHFSRFVDRGAAIVNRRNRVVGVLYDEVPLDDPNGRRVLHGLATPIGAVLRALQTQTGKEFKVARAEEVNQVRTTNLRVALPQAESPGLLPASQPIERAPLPGHGFLPDVLLDSPGGAAVLAAYRRHEEEVRDLIERNRRVAAVWQRSGGPALLQAVIGALRTPSATIPGSVNGVPTATCLDRLQAVFSRYGSAELRADLARVRLRMPSIAGLSAMEVLAAIDLEPHRAAVHP